MRKIKDKLLKSRQLINNLITLLDEMECEYSRVVVNRIVSNVFELVDGVADVEIDIYQFLKEKQDEV